MRQLKLLIADDHAVVRDGLKMLIATQPDLAIVGEAADGEQAVELAGKLHPDVVIMDVAMPRFGGGKATEALLRRSPDSKVLVLSGYCDEETVSRLIQAGAVGYLTKHSAAEDLLRAIREVAEGKVFFSSGIRKRHKPSTGKPTGRRLSPREKEVLNYIAAGQANKQIAGLLGLSIKTIEKHRQKVMNKLDIHDTAGLTRYAICRGMSPAPAKARSVGI
jgi:DNA-binding NarL/FixJ family response regulator